MLLDLRSLEEAASGTNTFIAAGTGGMTIAGQAATTIIPIAVAQGSGDDYWDVDYESPEEKRRKRAERLRQQRIDIGLLPPDLPPKAPVTPKKVAIKPVKVTDERRFERVMEQAERVLAERKQADERKQARERAKKLAEQRKLEADKQAKREAEMQAYVVQEIARLAAEQAEDEALTLLLLA